MDSFPPIDFELAWTSVDLPVSRCGGGRRREVTAPSVGGERFPRSPTSSAPANREASPSGRGSSLLDQVSPSATNRGA
ncbi:MAG: hypothetical protein RXR41_03420 [Candidatus Marsarchaeota archaeon]